MSEILLQPANCLFQRAGDSAVTTSSTVSPGSSVTLDVDRWFREGTVVRIALQAKSATLQTDLEVFGRDTYQESDLVYRAQGIDAYSSQYEDLIPFYYKDLDDNGELHIKIINNGSVSSEYTIEVVGVGQQGGYHFYFAPRDEETVRDLGHHRRQGAWTWDTTCFGRKQ